MNSKEVALALQGCAGGSQALAETVLRTVCDDRADGSMERLQRAAVLAHLKTCSTISSHVYVASPFVARHYIIGACMRAHALSAVARRLWSNLPGPTAELPKVRGSWHRLEIR